MNNRPNQYKKELAFLDTYDFSNCLVCGVCANGCPTTGAPAQQGWDARKVMRLLANGLVDEVVASDFPWLCTGCGRCTATCPGGIDITAIMGHLKSLRPREDVPGSLHKGMVNNLETGNNLGISKTDYLEGMAELGEELAEELPGFFVPVDKHGADILFFPNSKEVYGDFEDQYWWWKIFYAARENWTVPSENWEAVDWALFTGNETANTELARRKITFMQQHDIKSLIMPDCGGGSYGFRKGMTKLVAEDPANAVDFMYLYDYLMDRIKSGRLTLDPSVHAGKTFTFHDSCKHGRELERNFGTGYFDEPRWIVQQCVDDFVELTPNREKNYCCGAGGGMWPMPFEEQSAWHARYKYEQIKNSGADVVVVGCSNCRDQIMKRIPKFFDGYQFEVKYLWQLVAEALVIEPWPEHMAQLAQKSATAQWEELGIHLD
ncbi:4Fe-4S dicluster domain-containing protein [Pseudodesulfovibrio sp. JC047]|uniref:(Fe-S)-binding protein n=1 Tax=Pseudodesulfovibrio sp. JC047 TaxID=2683199 RepID=UPI0013D7392F|nr:(Fe-S)-binding protein [Pseudodesulfovibrio sp. JC047]NDV18643.1 4Fe-4S dicluster domain-containing protein [Pseudodesulfovibrio sp. JC047]